MLELALIQFAMQKAVAKVTFILFRRNLFFCCLEYADSTVGLSAGYNSRRCQGGSSGELLGDGILSKHTYTFPFLS